MKIRYNREIISGAIFCGSERSAVVPDSRTGPDAGENANQRTDLPPYRHWWYVPLLCRSVCWRIFVREKQELYVTKESFRSNAFKKKCVP